MKKLFFLVFAMCICILGEAQQKDTSIIKKQKGFLFLSKHNYRYDKSEMESRPLGFHDFFFPGECLDSLLFLDSNKAITFKNGLRVDYINNRPPLKQNASLLKGKDTSMCYVYDQFYIIPVSISYKQFEDYEPFECRHNYFDIKVDQGATLHFEYQHQMIKPIEITPIRKEKVQIKKVRK